jgi:multiple sugar transport system permease protein
MSGSLRLTWVTLVGAVVLLILYGIPIVWLVAASLKTSADLFRGDTGLIFTPSFAAYQQIWGQGLVRAAVNSTIVAFGVTALTVGLAVPAAYALARLSGSIVAIGLGLVILLQMTPQTATVIPLYRVLGGWGLLSLAGVILADSGLLLPFCILLLRPFFLSVPKEVEEAASVDGATRWRVFGQIVLPLAMNGAATAATVIFLISWGEFLYAISFLVDPTQYTISVLIASQVGQYGIEWPLLMAVAVMASLPILVVFAFTYRLLKQGLALGAGR